MEEITIKIEVPSKEEKFKLAIAEAIKKAINKTIAEKLRERLNSKEEKELIKWSVQLGRKSKKESFKRLLSELSQEERGEILNRIK